MARQTGGENVGNVLEIEELLDQINGERVQSNHFKEESPLAISLNINDPVKESEQQHAPAIAVEGVGTCPETGNDGKHRTPGQAQRKACDSSPGQRQNFETLASPGLQNVGAEY